MTKSGALIKNKLLANQWSFLLIVVAILSAVAGSVNPRYWWLGNLTNLLGQISVLSLVACGATILIISGNFDISVGANIGLASVVMAILMRNGIFPSVAAGIGILISVVCGSAIGAASILFQAPSFIISLAAIGVFQGIALFITQGTIQTIYGQFETLGGAKLFNVVPLLFVIALAGYGVIHCILAHTQLGRCVYAIGNNPRAAYLAGISVNRKKLLFFALNGLFVGVAAMLLLSRVGAAQPSTGTGIELQAIGAAVIGGASLFGGEGNPLGALVGALTLGAMQNGLTLLNVPSFWQLVATGVVVIVAVFADQITRKRR